MFKKLACFFVGHKKGPKILSKSPNSIHICDRCGSVFSRKITAKVTK